MTKKGSVTVFLALVLSLMLSLICTSVESVRMAAARTQILGSLDIGLYSLFGQYDSSLLKEYDLFFLDGSCGGGMLHMAGLYDNMKSYMEPVLKQNSQKLSIVQGGFTGYRLATDEEGEAFYHQIVQYMKETLGSQGIQLLLKQTKERQKKTKEAEESGNQAENGKMLESYESEMNSAAQSSQAAQEAQQQNQNGGNNADVFGSGQGDAGAPSFSSNADQNVVNPVTVIQRIRKMGLLQLVLPPGRSVSDKKISRKTLVSGRTLQKGFGFTETLKKDTSYTSGLLYQQYLMEKLGNFRRPSSKGLGYQVEYILEGKDNDLDNLKAVAGKLLIIREGVNFAHLLSEPGKRSQAAALAAGIAATFLIPPAVSVIEKALLLCWAFGESILDVRELLDGGKVPLVKSAADWQLSLGNLSNLMDSLDTRRHSVKDGMSYEDYLQVLLLSKSRNVKLKRGMDMVELGIRSMPQRDQFLLDSCITAIEASVDVQANRRKVFTVTKQYGYE